MLSCGVTTTMKGWVIGEPRQSRLAGVTRTSLKTASPGLTAIEGWPIRKPSRPPSSTPISTAVTGTLPRLSTATLCRPCRLPCEVCGTSSAVVSRNGRTSTTPSGTTASCGCSVGVTTTPYRSSPAGTAAARGGWKLIVAVVDAPG